jgi:hypothetical protein
MNGWMIIFALTSMTSGLWGGSNESPAALFASGIFGLLFLLSIGARAVRGEAC